MFFNYLVLSDFAKSSRVVDPESAFQPPKEFT